MVGERLVMNDDNESKVVVREKKAEHSEFTAPYLRVQYEDDLSIEYIFEPQFEEKVNTYASPRRESDDQPPPLPIEHSNNNNNKCLRGGKLPSGNTAKSASWDDYCLGGLDNDESRKKKIRKTEGKALFVRRQSKKKTRKTEEGEGKALFVRRPGDVFMGRGLTVALRNTEFDQFLAEKLPEYENCGRATTKCVSTKATPVHDF